MLPHGSRKIPHQEMDQLPEQTVFFLVKPAMTTQYQAMQYIYQCRAVMTSLCQAVMIADLPVALREIGQRNFRFARIPLFFSSISSSC
jgi:hypothetical protein